MKALQVITTVDSREAAERIVSELVENKLAACVQLHGPITSTYWWQGKVEKATEWVITAKTTPELYQKVEETIARLHPYTVPEIIALPIEKIYGPYLEWLLSTVSSSAP